MRVTASRRGVARAATAALMSSSNTLAAILGPRACGCCGLAAGCCGATAGYDPPEDTRFIWTFELQILGSNGWAREDIAALLDLVQSGQLEAVVDATYPLERAAEALARLEDRQVFGKLVIVP